MHTQGALALAELEVSDLTGQKTARVGNIPVECRVSEMLQDILAELQMPQTDGAGRPLVYHARLEREGRHLHGSERVGDALVEGDKVVLTPNIEAGVGEA